MFFQKLRKYYPHDIIVVRKESTLSPPMIQPIYLTVPRRHRKAMKKLFMRSVVRNLFNIFRQNQCYEDMVRGFQKRYHTMNLHESHLDGTTDWYLSPLYHCEADLMDTPNTNDVFALDLGCGPASICYWLKDNGYNWSYMGVDMIEEAKKYVTPLSDASFLTKKIEALCAGDLPRKPDVIFAVNSLCFVPDIEEVMKNLFDLSQPGTKMIMIDACPSHLWDKGKAGTTHETEYIHDVLKNTGWMLRKNFVLSIYNIANIPIMSVSHSFLCERA